MAYLDPGMTGTAQQARDQFNTVARQRRGSDLTDDEFNSLGQRVGVTGDSVTGQQYNSALDLMGWGDTGGTGVPQPTQPQPTQPAPRTGGIDPLEGMPASDPNRQTPNLTALSGPTNPGPQQQTGGMPLAQATQQIESAFQQRFGRPMTAQEQQMAADHARQNGWNGDPNSVPQSAIDAVMAGMAGYQGGGTPPPQTGGVDPSPGGQTPGGPGTGGIDPMPGGETPETPVDPGQAQQQVTSAFQQRFGREPTPQEWAQINAAAGYSGSGPISQQMLQAALAAIQNYQAPGTPEPLPGGETPGTPAPGTNPLDPGTVQTQVTNAFQQRFGRQPTAQEWQWIQEMAGYSGGPITQQMVDAAMDAVARYTGNQQTPFEPPGQQDDPTQAAARARLEELLGLSYGEVDMNSPQMKQQMDTYRRNVQQGSNKLRAQQMERAAQSGAVGTGGVDVMQDQIAEREGEGVADFQSGLISDELKTQRASLMEAIDLAMQTGQQDKARELQDRLGTLDIDLRKYLGKGQLGLGLLSALMGDNQFYDQLGFNYAGLQQRANSDAVRAILGM